jgi:hypothetical protein
MGLEQSKWCCDTKKIPSKKPKGQEGDFSVSLDFIWHGKTLHLMKIGLKNEKMLQNAMIVSSSNGGEAYHIVSPNTVLIRPEPASFSRCRTKKIILSLSLYRLVDRLRSCPISRSDHRLCLSARMRPVLAAAEYLIPPLRAPDLCRRRPCLHRRIPSQWTAPLANSPQGARRARYTRRAGPPPPAGAVGQPRQALRRQSGQEPGPARFAARVRQSR